jgi:hypothetical protein
MSQTYTDDCYASNHQAATDLQAFENNFAALKSAFSGATQPANTVAGMWWLDTTAHILKHRNEANTAWLSVWDMANNKPVIANLSNEITAAMISSTYKDGAAATASLRTLGTGAHQACAGNDARLSDARTANGGNATNATNATNAVNADTVDNLHFQITSAPAGGGGTDYSLQVYYAGAWCTAGGWHTPT